MDTTTSIEKEFKLPREFAEKWLADLRSGNYKQAAGILYDEHKDGFCCLGVACMTAGYTTNDIRSKNGYATTITITGKGIHENDYSANLLNPLPFVPDELKGASDNDNLVSMLTGMNDVGSSFEEIADWVENNVTFY